MKKVFNLFISSYNRLLFSNNLLNFIDTIDKYNIDEIISSFVHKQIYDGLNYNNNIEYIKQDYRKIIFDAFNNIEDTSNSEFIEKIHKIMLNNCENYLSLNDAIQLQSLLINPIFFNFISLSNSKYFLIGLFYDKYVDKFNKLKEKLKNNNEEFYDDPYYILEKDSKTKIILSFYKDFFVTFIKELIFNLFNVFNNVILKNNETKNFEKNLKNIINDLDNDWIKLTDELQNMITLYKSEYQ